MKKVITLIIIIFISTSAFAVDHEFIGKLGTSYAHDLDNFGLDISLNYIYDLDPYFTAGFEADLYWVSWEKKLGTKPGPPEKEVVTNTNAYSIPVYFNVQLRLPFLEKKFFVEPYVTIGLGYSFMILNYHQPEFADSDGDSYRDKDVTDFYHGFTWQFIPGVSFRPSSESRVRFVGEIGYRGLEEKNSDEKIVMSGILMRLGVIFSI